MDDEEGLGCDVEATLLQTPLLTRQKDTAVHVEIQALPHVVCDPVVDRLVVVEHFKLLI